MIPTRSTFALLWGFPFLVSGQGLTPSAASGLLIVMTITAVVTSPLIGAFFTRWPPHITTPRSKRGPVIHHVRGLHSVVLVWPGRAPLWLLVVLVVVLAVGGPGSMVGFDLARTFNPPTRLGSATGIVNVGGFVASLGTVALIGVVLDNVAPGGPSTYTAGLVPCRHVGVVPRVGARCGPDPALPTQGQTRAETRPAESVSRDATGHPRQLNGGFGSSGISAGGRCPPPTPHGLTRSAQSLPTRHAKDSATAFGGSPDGCPVRKRQCAIARVWADHLKHWRMDTFQRSVDSHFEDKLVDVVRLYLNPPGRAVVFNFR